MLLLCITLLTNFNHNMKHTSFLALLLSFFSLTGFAENIHFESINSNDGLSQITILSIYQDEIGTFWFGSSEGLNRYNGNHIEIYRPAQDNKGLTRNEIESITGDKNGSIYIRSVSDLIRFDLKNEKFTCIQEKCASTMFCRQDTLWIGFNKTLSYYLKSDNKIHKVADLDFNFGYGTSLIVEDDHIWVRHLNGVAKISRQNYKTIMDFPIKTASTIYMDSRNNVWVGTLQNGITVIHPNFKTTRFTDKTNLTNNTVRTIVEDNKGNIWVGTFHGLNHYIIDKETWINHVHQDGMAYSLTHNSINSLYKDIQGNIWVGTYYGGVNYFNPETNTCRYYGHGKDNKNLLSFPFVGHMAEDTQGNLWICSEGGGLNKLDKRTQTFKHYTYHEKGKDESSHNNIKCIYYVKDKDVLYIGTHTGGLDVFDIKKEKFRTLEPFTEEPSIRTAGNIINQIQPYGDKFAVLTQAGLYLLDPITETFSPISSNTKIKSLLTRMFKHQTFLIDSKQRLWLSLSKGGLVTIDLKNDTYQEYFYHEGDSTSIGKFKIMNIIETTNGEIYLGTIGSGLFKYIPETDSFKNYSIENGALSNNYCYSVCESPIFHHLLILHNRSFSVFDREKGKTKSSYSLYKMGYYEGSNIYFTKDNLTFIGGINGMISFYEPKLYDVNDNYRIYFDRLWINNTMILPNDSTGIIKKHLSEIDELELSHKQNNLSLELCTSNYTIKEKLFYEYKLEGFSDKWAPLKSSTISYTNLSPGRYTLKVRELQGIQQTSINIHIVPPFRATIYAYILYVLAVLAVMFAVIHVRLRHIKLQASLNYERKEKERTEELNKNKLKFFTNVSHEYRTPLTLIIGQLEALISLSKLTPNVYNRVLHIYKNALLMRYLINEILDFRKIDQGHLKLKLEYRDFIPFIKNIASSFNEYAAFRHITYQYDYPEEEIKLWFDPMQMQKVIYNIVSNAFKYTSEGGKISILLKCNESCVYVSIKDTGCGIPVDEIKRIFERFYQTEVSSGKVSLSTGIGLELAKEIMELHHGDIKVESQEGVGSEFTIELLKGNAHFTPEEMKKSSTIVSDYIPSIANDAFSLIEMDEEEEEGKDDNSEKEEKDTQNESSDAKMKLLIVDDNEEMLSLLKDLFKNTYTVCCARNGKEGLDAAYREHPNLIISDVMMPVMSGKELCYKLKNNVELSHIPVILLTALGTEQQEMEGYVFGADDYITKPFSSKLLITRCNNIIKNRQTLYRYFKNLQHDSNDVLTVTNEIGKSDNEFVKAATDIIKENFDNPNFDMNMLASKLNMGRSKLYSYMKENTGFTPNEFTLKLKLEKAYDMLKNAPELNIAEISYKLGFSSPRYFSKCFKDFYGTAPLKVRKGASDSDKKEEDEGIE